MRLTLAPPRLPASLFSRFSQKRTRLRDSAGGFRAAELAFAITVHGETMRAAEDLEAPGGAGFGAEILDVRRAIGRDLAATRQLPQRTRRALWLGQRLDAARRARVVGLIGFGRQALLAQ